MILGFTVVTLYFRYKTFFELQKDEVNIFHFYKVFNLNNFLH